MGYSPWTSPGQNTRVGSLSIFQWIFPTQGLNPGLPHCRWILYQLSHKGSPRTLEWVAYPFSRGSSWPRNWTGVSCIAGGFFANWAMREALACCNYRKPAPNNEDLVQPKIKNKLKKNWPISPVSDSNSFSFWRFFWCGPFFKSLLNLLQHWIELKSLSRVRIFVTHGL